MARRCLEDAMRSAHGVQQGKQDVVSKFNEVVNVHSIKLDKHYGGVYSLQYNFDGTRVCAGFSGGGIRMYNGQTGDMIRELRPNRHGGYAAMCLHWHPKERHVLYAATAEGHVYLINTETGELKDIIHEPTNEINTMDFSVDGYFFCTCGKDLTVRVYRADNGKLDKTFEGYGSKNVAALSNSQMEAGNTMRVYALTFSPENENIFLTAGWDNHIKIWDIRTTDGIKRQIHGPHVCGNALDMKEYKILSGSWCANHALQEWDYREGKVLNDIKFPHTKGAFLYCAQYGDMDVALAGGSGTNSAEIVEIGTNRHIGSVPMTKPVQALDSALGGKFFAVGGGDNEIKLCSLK